MQKTTRLLSLCLALGATTVSSCAQEATQVAGAPKDISHAEGELVSNGGFEAAAVGAPVAWDTVPGWDIVPFLVDISSLAHSGGKSLKLETRDSGYTTRALQNTGPFQKGKPYRLHYNVRTDRFGVEYRVYIGVWKGGTGLQEVETQWRQGTDTWHDISVDFTPNSEGDHLSLILQVRGPGAAWFDDISIAPRKDEAGAAPAAPLPSLAKAPAGPDAGKAGGVQITADGRFQLDGKPFFPIMIWGWNPKTELALAQAAQWGFNVLGTSLDSPHRLSDIGPYGTKLWLDAAARHKMHIMATLNFNLPPNRAADELKKRIQATEPIMPVLRDHPATFGYNISDEPAWAGHDVAKFAEGARWIRSQDARHPIYVNHAPRNSIEELKRYNAWIDIAGSDIYPVTSGPIVSVPSNHSDLPNTTLSVVGDETSKNLAAVDFKKPVMQTLQGFKLAENASFPTIRQSRFMAWDSIIAGATGVAWFQNGVKTLAPELKTVVNEFAALQDVLAGGENISTKGLFAAPIKSIGYKWKDKTVLVAINPTDKPLQAQPQWKAVPGAGTRTLRVLGEKRNSGATPESFEPFDVHIYTDAAQDSDILRAGFTIAH